VSLNAVLSDGEDSKYGMFRSKKPIATQRERERERERGFMVLVLTYLISKTSLLHACCSGNRYHFSQNSTVFHLKNVALNTK
jgi:hypothetical protein